MIKKQYKWIIVVLMIATVGLLAGCGKDKDQTKNAKVKQTAITAKLKTPVKQLFFNGTLSPIDTYPVISPIEGTITKLNFAYGEKINKNQLLAILSSETLSKNFRQTVSDFLQKKDAYDNAVESYQGSVALYKAGVISKEAFIQDRTQYENTVLSYFQSRFSLMQIAMKANLSGMDIAKIQISDFKTVHQLLKRKFNDIKIYAPEAGIALFPEPSQSNGSSGSQTSNSGKLLVGSSVKAGQLMLNIGDLNGLSAKISVNEVNINRIKVGMPTIVTGDAFPGITLKGEVAQVSSQADPEQQGGGGGTSQSLFSVLVKIPTLTPEEQKIIRVGMTAKIQIDIKQEPSILLPLKAVTLKNGVHYVTLQEKDGTTKQVQVVVGSTTPQGEISIVSGVKAGDKVIVND